MDNIEEVHGLYQCKKDPSDQPTQDADEYEEESNFPLPAKENWFLDESLRLAEARGLHNDRYADSLDFVHVKHQLDSVYLAKKYTEGLRLAKQCFEHHGKEVKRELADLLGQFAIKCNDFDAMDTCMKWFDESSSVQDTGIHWLRICIARARGDNALLRQACEGYLCMRPDEPAILEILHSL